MLPERVEYGSPLVSLSDLQPLRTDVLKCPRTDLGRPRTVADNDAAGYHGRLEKVSPAKRLDKGS